MNLGKSGVPSLKSMLGFLSNVKTLKHEQWCFTISHYSCSEIVHKCISHRLHIQFFMPHYSLWRAMERKTVEHRQKIHFTICRMCRFLREGIKPMANRSPFHHFLGRMSNGKIIFYCVENCLNVVWNRKSVLREFTTVCTGRWVVPLNQSSIYYANENGLFVGKDLKRENTTNMSMKPLDGLVSQAQNRPGGD